MVRQTHFKLAACLACWLTICLHCLTCAGQDAKPLAEAAGAAPNTIILKDGGVLVGNVSLAGDRYIVTRVGSEIQIATANVLLICGSLDEAYELRREKIARSDVASHLALADWCLRYNLVSQATGELVDARRLDPLHPRVGLLERRLAAATASRTQSARPANSPVAEVATPASGSALANTAARIDELPAGAVERFTRKVQPILVNNCTASGCHQPGGPQNFQLDRSLLHGPGNRRTTMRNLAATLSIIDREQPQLSPLLTVPRETHAGMDRPIIGPRQQAAFEHLVDWVDLITNSEDDAEKTTQPNSATDIAAEDVAEMSTVTESNTSLPDKVTPPAAIEEYAPARPRPIRFGAQLQPWQPKDPFDPEIFNRAQRLPPETNGVQEQEGASSERVE